MVTGKFFFNINYTKKTLTFQALAVWYADGDQSVHLGSPTDYTSCNGTAFAVRSMTRTSRSAGGN